MAPKQYRVADLAVYADTEPRESLPTQAPLVVVEIVSPDDRYRELMTKLASYEAWGVRHIWVVDPELRQFHVYSKGSFTAVQAFELPERDLRIELSEILREPSS